MSVLLFHPRAEFDFNKSSRSLNKVHTSIRITLLGIFFAVLVFAIFYRAISAAPQHSQISLIHYNIDLNKPKIFSETKLNSIEPLPSAPKANFSVTVPVLMYHYTPTNFELQLQHLQSHGYTTITMSQLGKFLYTGAPLPAKPVIITFDDGFLDQETAFSLLHKYQMKATYYIILGGEESNHCIGLSRTNLACGDSYLNWTEVKELVDSGLIEIGAHTLNHPDLPILSEEKQWQEISESKKRLEDMYNLSVTTFAYPYGRYNQASLDLVKRAGYLTAVTTYSDTLVTSDNRYTIPRVRDALLLP